MKTKFILILAAILVVDFAWGQGCSQCKLLSQQGSELDENSFGSNINTGILYLMAVPYILLMVLFRRKISAVFKNLVKN